MIEAPPLSWRAADRRIGTYEEDRERRRSSRMTISTAKRVIGRPKLKRRPRREWSKR